ncbi:SRPBCC domain-containing protein [Bosea eneae]|uniref:SRPBCC domain-containing protein n=1 Tax=Bosea eneae TaxID=151454 RepID=A0ABW0IND0_9HYPH
MIELKPATQAIIVDEILPHAPETIWKALTSSRLIARWIMEPTGFAPVVGTRFTFKTTPAGAWDGTIHCQVLEVIPNERLSYSWKGGDDGNVGYGSRLDTVVTWTLYRQGDDTRVRLVHSGFELPRNEIALTNMGRGWKSILPRLGDVAGEDD